MNVNFVLDDFIKTHVTKRRESLFAADLRHHDATLRERLGGRNVLVIGGAGTIGSSYVKTIVRYPIRSLCVVDLNENGLTELVRDLRSSAGVRVPDPFITYPVGLGGRVFEKIFRRLGPFDVVANFAAHKHVRSEKDVFSIEAMIENNVFRARRLLDLLAARPPEHFFCVSTDKAANPVNIMGASKKLMEEVIMAYADRVPVTTARFANVAFSNGSLPIGFLDRLNQRQPWSCPTGIKRYFISPQESGEICLMASVLGASGEIFFPKLDEQRDMLEFSEIALALLRALGLEPDVCQTEDGARQKAAALSDRPTRYPIYFFESDTSGEKPTEEFVTSGEAADLDRFASLGVIRNAKRRALAEVDVIVNRLRACFEAENVDKAEVVEILKSYLPTFAHIEKGRNLDQRM